MASNVRFTLTCFSQNGALFGALPVVRFQSSIVRFRHEGLLVACSEGEDCTASVVILIDRSVD